MGASLMWQTSLAQHGDLREQVSMSRYTTLGVGGLARWFFTPLNLQDMIHAMPFIPRNIRLLPLGRGSNMLISDQGFDGIVIDLRALKKLKFISEKQVYAQAGVRMNRISRHCAEKGLAGLEFMATVPGDIGGGVAMNAGAFVQQVSDTLQSISVLYPDGSCASIEAVDLNMSYRHTLLPEKCIILDATFQLSHKNTNVLKAAIISMREERSRNQPLSLANCGSIFKNPEGDYAARLLEKSGLKGKQVGGAQFSTKHANFIVNHGGAQCADIVALIKYAQAEVLRQFSVQLETEVRMV